MVILFTLWVGTVNKISFLEGNLALNLFMYIPFHPGILEKYGVNKRKFISALFVIAKVCKPSNSSSVKEWLKFTICSYYRIHCY